MEIIADAATFLLAPFEFSTHSGSRTCRSSRLKVFCKKAVLKNFAKFTGKHLCQSLFFNKVADLRPATLLKKRLWHRCFPVDFAKLLRTPFFTEYLHWLLLKFISHHTKEILYVNTNLMGNQP